MLLMLLLGIGAAWTNIPIIARDSVAMPDHFRSRVNSITPSYPMGRLPSPARWRDGSASREPWSAWEGLCCFFFRRFSIPGFAEFFRRPPSKLSGYFLAAYPNAFNEK